MWSILKAAFWHRERLPLLGSVPVNALALAAFAALGFGHPLFWWAGIGLESTWLFLCATSPRYRRVALLPGRESLEARAAEQQQTIFLQLNPDHRRRHEALRGRIRKIAGLWDENGGASGVDTSSTAGTTTGTGMDQLEWLHLKFLVGKQHLESARDEAPEAAIAERLAALKAQLARPGTDAASHGPLESTIRIVGERLATSAERSRRLDEIDASLHHIEQQLELTLEKALLRTGVAGQTHTIDLASHTLDASADLFGSTLSAVSDLDHWHSASAAADRALSA